MSLRQHTVDVSLAGRAAAGDDAQLAAETEKLDGIRDAIAAAMDRAHEAMHAAGAAERASTLKSALSRMAPGRNVVMDASPKRRAAHAAETLRRLA